MTWLMWLQHYVDTANARDFIKPCFYTTHFAFVYFAVQIMINERTITTILPTPHLALGCLPLFSLGKKKYVGP